ncbi:hypothetical protein SARC_01969 [Sphaeroforma arctica JP610]|uniref:Uncharacterized protein n=1 Tax=Sphaeroforma arctica JP610 TaxID=667725 RepID=A0A0L0GA31_9EUKA|nr:hypothetical protein SARC_01969 [Sphaeroforma arctica JP610]KNC85860.1 hypothetical protein SARC_01969 [Sphaeroforma arctica JP610]|eukprot:XP_014159762.1 hypothetical protein SARC_01969 [Sphaeroforma arctica JP610]
MTFSIKEITVGMVEGPSPEPGDPSCPFGVVSLLMYTPPPVPYPFGVMGEGGDPPPPTPSVPREDCSIRGWWRVPPRVPGRRPILSLRGSVGTLIIYYILHAPAVPSGALYDRIAP